VATLETILLFLSKVATGYLSYLICITFDFMPREIGLWHYLLNELWIMMYVLLVVVKQVVALPED
jgi:hypothetical protein